MIELRRAVHLAVFAGLSATAYAGSLALATMLQSSVDAAAIAERAPVHDLAARVGRNHDALTTTLSAATRRYSLMADRYAALLPTLTTLEASLDELVRTTSDVTDSTLTLPTHLSLPAVQAAPRIVYAVPATHATTGASGR